MPREVSTARRMRTPPAAAGHGTLDLLVVPDAELYLDGFQLGRVRAKSFPLEAGKHTLRLVNSSLGKDVTRKITVTAGQITYVDINLKEE
jgi:eukaryotic-like serine/threonine-protein kinase